MSSMAIDLLSSDYGPTGIGESRRDSDARIAGHIAVSNAVNLTDWKKKMREHDRAQMRALRHALSLPPVVA